MKKILFSIVLLYATTIHSQVMRNVLNNTGNVGIGNTNPINKLTIGLTVPGISGNDIAIGNGTQSMSFYQSENSIWYTTSNFAVLPGIRGNGYLGIGTATPLAKLHVAGNIKVDGNNTIEFGAGVPGKEVSAGKIGYRAFGAFDALDIVGAGTSGNNRKITFWNEGGAEFRGSIGIGYPNPIAGYKLSVNGGGYINGVFVTTGDAEIEKDAQIGGNLNVNGRICIGGTPATVPFEVFSSATYNRLNSWTLYKNATFSENILCIKAHGDIQASVFVSTSDARIKKITGLSNSTNDLETINALKITNYTMLDKLQYGDKSFKKIIAQDVEKVYPQVVTTNVGYIPNVYAEPDKIVKTKNGLLLSFSSPHNLSKEAKKIQVISGKETKQFQIIAIPSHNQVLIEATDLKPGEIFVYGEEVNDLRQVDYDSLVTLNISASQELSKRLNNQQQLIELLLKRIISLEKKELVQK